MDNNIICNRCCKKFKFQSQLERHNGSIRQCKIKTNDNICFHCNIKCSTKYTLIRHYKTCKIKKQRELQQITNTSNLNILQTSHAIPNMSNVVNITDKEYQSLNKIVSSLKNSNPDNNSQFDKLISIIGELASIVVSNNTKKTQNKTHQNNNSNNSINSNNSNNIVNTTINAETINTNPTIINHNYGNLPNVIYPFGYENINFLNQDEMLEILKSSNGVELALQRVYSMPENRNFHRPNANKDFIRVINSDMTVKSQNTKDFNSQMITQGVILMERMLHKCKNNLSFRDQFIVVNNIEEIRKSLMFETNITSILNIIETCFQDPVSKEIFKKFSDLLCREENFKKNKINLIRQLLEELERFNSERLRITISDNFLKQEVWSEEESRNEDADFDSIKNNLNIHYLQKTPRYKFLNKMQQDEMEYFDMHGISLGDIFEYRKILLQRAKDEIEKISKHYNNEFLTNEVSNKLINEPNTKLKSYLPSVQFNNNNFENTITNN